MIKQNKLKTLDIIYKIGETVNPKAMLLILILITTFNLCLFANLPPVVSNVTATQRTDGSKIVDIHYDVIDAENDTLTVTLVVSNNNGSTFTITPTLANLSGHIGWGVLPGTAKHIIWSAGAENQVFDAGNFVFKVTADDGYNMVFVQGGTFNNGTSNVTVSSFYISKYEVTQASYLSVMGINPAYFNTVVNGPVEQVTWFKAIEYCNKRSIREGLIPCYGYSTFGTNPSNWPAGWNTIDANHSNLTCSWTANGYRLPTEMEWMYAARGGNLTHNYTYSGSNTIGDVAWYISNSNNTTHPIGTKTSNELGMYDMSGNVWEWCWDIFGSYLTGAQTNPHGATSGSTRTRRGGRWDGDASSCEVTFRSSALGTSSFQTLGFRVCRTEDNLVLVGGGSFNNGTSDVTLSSFYIDKFEITQSAYQAVMGSNPSYFAAVVNGPVERVSWFNAIEYCNRRSINEGLTPCYSYSTFGTNPASWPVGWNTSDSNRLNVACNWTANGYRLPTEMEWQFAARGGNLTHDYTYSGANTIDGVAWYATNSSNTTHAIGLKATNELGLYDMSGNVWEWCWDIQGAYPSGSQVNPHGAVSGSITVHRGGSYLYDSTLCTVAYRGGRASNTSGYNTGFRVCRNAQ